MDHLTFMRRLSSKFQSPGWRLGLIGVSAVSFGVAAAAATSGMRSDVSEILGTRLPKTKLTAVDCDKIDGLCEVQAGSNLFYTDRGGRYLIVGRVYDMETRQDLTAARLLEINPDMLVGALAAEGASGGNEDVQRPQPSEARDVSAQKVDVAELKKLPVDGAITWGSGPATITVLSDFRCGYCKRLHETLSAMNVRVIERPISILGSRAVSDAVMCSNDRRKALKLAYEGSAISNVSACKTSGLDANEAFARAHGFNGTPVIIRSDGAVINGYRPRAFLEKWIRGEEL